MLGLFEQKYRYPAILFMLSVIDELLVRVWVFDGQNANKKQNEMYKLRLG